MSPECVVASQLMAVSIQIFSKAPYATTYVCRSSSGAQSLSDITTRRLPSAASEMRMKFDRQPRYRAAWQTPRGSA